MIGAPTVDPREGDRRTKALAKALAARARVASALSRTARTGVGRGARTGAGIRVIGAGARPGASLSFLSAKGPNGFGPGGVNFFGANPGLGALVAATQLPTAALPGGGVGGGKGPGGSLGGGVPFGGSTGNPYADDALLEAESIYGTADNPSALSKATQESMLGSSPGATLADIVPGYSQPTPSAPIYVGGGGLPGGLIPLGGGVFYDPDSGQLHGSGLL